MLALIAAVVFQSGTLERDAFGVPHISAPTLEAAFQQAGYAVAQDRLWQMENSRRLARGRMAEAFGPTFAASDREVLSFAYTDDELKAQIATLSPKTRSMLSAYVRGINAWLDEAKTQSKLPSGYAQNGFEPEPWTELDSAAVAIRLFQLFGKGGAGEIRNLALLGYLQGRAETKDRVLDVLEDFAWFSDRTATTTILPGDDPLRKSPPDFAIPNRATTAKHVGALPRVSLLELLPGVRLAEMRNSTAVAESVAAPSKWGSYAVVVAPNRSATAYPILLSAPQMGFRTPSVIHEMSISAPGYEVVGMDVPGVPGIAIGHSRDLAWGLTSGVADTDDIVYNTLEGDGYLVGGVKRAFDTATFQINVKGGSPQSFIQKRTSWGPVVLESKTAKVVFSRRSASRGKELQSLESVSMIGSIKSATEVEAALRSATVNFNCFYATSAGDIGYRYTGLVPLRAPGYDPRFPVPGEAGAEWRGMVPFEKMPHVRNPKGGLLANWNNKPVDWWPNSDTPVWGRIFRNTELLAVLQSQKIGPSDVERAAWTIARKDETWPYFKPFVEREWKGTPLEGFDGWMLDGSMQAQSYRYFFDALREELFLPVTGNFVAPDNFRLIAQPSVMLNALEGKTKVDYLRGRSASAVVRDALAKGLERRPGPRFAAPSILVPDQAPIPYSNRGSYIQIVEFAKGGISGRNVVTPGVAESGSHAFDQVPLARAWTYKPMVWKR